MGLGFKKIILFLLHRCPCGVAHWHVKVEVAYTEKAKRGDTCESSPFILCPEKLALLLIFQIDLLLNSAGFSFQSAYSFV